MVRVHQGALHLDVVPPFATAGRVAHRVQFGCDGGSGESLGPSLLHDGSQVGLGSVGLASPSFGSGNSATLSLGTQLSLGTLGVSQGLGQLWPIRFAARFDFGIERGDYEPGDYRPLLRSIGVVGRLLGFQPQARCPFVDTREPCSVRLEPIRKPSAERGAGTFCSLGTAK